MKTGTIAGVLAFGIFTFSQLALLAQSPPPGPGGGGGVGAPIDSGVLALVMGAAVYGYRRIKENKVQKVQE